MTSLVTSQRHAFAPVLYALQIAIFVALARGWSKPASMIDMIGPWLTLAWGTVYILAGLFGLVAIIRGPRTPKPRRWLLAEFAASIVMLVTNGLYAVALIRNNILRAIAASEPIDDRAVMGTGITILAIAALGLAGLNRARQIRKELRGVVTATGG